MTEYDIIDAQIDTGQQLSDVELYPSERALLVRLLREKNRRLRIASLTHDECNAVMGLAHKQLVDHDRSTVAITAFGVAVAETLSQERR